MRGKTTPIFFSVLLLLSVTAVLSFIRSAHASPKSLYLVADHHTRQFDAWEIKPDGTTDYQATYRLSYATDPAGIAIDETSNTLFITSEFSGGVEMVDATTMTSVGVSAGPSNLAGIAVDDANDIVYAVRRWSDDLYVYDWNPSTNTLTVRAGYNPLNLPGCSGAFGLGLDEIRGILWVADSAAGIVRAYDTDTWTEDTSQSFTPSHKAVDVAIDRMRRLVYTVSMSLGASVPGGCGSNLLSKYDLTARTETTVNLGHQGVGVAVDELTGYVYVTGDYYARRLEVWDVSPTPWIQVQQVSVSGRPAGICIPQEEVAFNPFNLSKDDGLAEGECISPGEDITYEICYDNTENSYDAHNVKIVDELPAEVEFVSATALGFVYPTGKKPTIDPPYVYEYGGGEAKTYYLFTGEHYAGWLARGDKDHYQEGWYHIGQDIEANVGDKVYAITYGDIVYVSYGGWGDGNCALFIEHSLSSGDKFWALYGHLNISSIKYELPETSGWVKPSIRINAGEAFAEIGWHITGPHLHFGIHEDPSPPSYIPKKKGFGMMNLTEYWSDASKPPSDTNGFVDPIHWLTTQTPKSPVSASGAYDSSTHTVTWDIGTLSAGAAQQCVKLIVHVSSAVAPGSTLVNYVTIDSDETLPTTISESTDVCPLPDEIGLEVAVTPTPPDGRDYYEKDDYINFEVTVTNPADVAGTDVTAYYVKLSAIEPEEIEIDVPAGGMEIAKILPGESKSTIFYGKAVKARDNVEVIVRAVGYTDLSDDVGKIRGRGSCTITIHDPDAPKPDWSFAIIADPHIGFNRPDYDGETWDDSGLGENYDISKYLENAVDKITTEKGPYNIEFVVILGDFADTAEKSEFLKAREILNRLNDPNGDGDTSDGIPYIPVIGDHDQWPYTQPNGKDFDPHNRADHATIADYACGDEFFNDKFWGEENNENLNLIENLFGVRLEKTEPSFVPGRAQPVYLQNRAFSYGNINFACLDFNPRTIEPGSWLGVFAHDHSQTKECLDEYLEGHKGEKTIVLTHHPLYELGGYLYPQTIEWLVTKHDSTMYNFAGHTHCDRIHYQLSAFWSKGYYVIETEPVSQIQFEIPFLDIPVCELTGASIRITQIEDGKIDCSTVLKPKEVEIRWPFPDFAYSYASYPVLNKEITFTAHFTTYHGFDTSFDWDFGDGSYASGLSAIHSYSQDGLYNVTLTVTTKNLVTGEEETYIVTRPVYVHSKHVISSLPSELNATSLLTGEDLTQIPKNTYQPALITKIASEETAIAELGVHFEEATEDIDLSTLVADVDLEEGKSVIYMPSWPAEIDDYKTLFIPSTGAETVYICLDATSLDEVILENADLIINVGETHDNVVVATTFYNGGEYYLVSGVTATGGGELKDTIPPTTVLTIGEPKYVDPTGKIYVSSATLFTLTAEDNLGGTGVASTAYNIRNATYDSGWIDYSAPFRLPLWLENGVYTIAYNSTDNMGNMEEENIVTIVLRNPLVDTWVTDSDFNEIESFRAVFTPHGNTQLHKLTATNPGQFYFNILVNNTWPEPLNMIINYSIDANFTLKGARPIHVYADLNRSIDITANCIFTDNTITVYNVAPNATVYVTIHLDYALKGMTWTAEEVEVWYSEHGFNATVGSVTSTVVITDPNLQAALMPARLILFLSILPILMLGLGAFVALLKHEMLGAERRK